MSVINDIYSARRPAVQLSSLLSMVATEIANPARKAKEGYDQVAQPAQASPSDRRLLILIPDPSPRRTTEDEGAM